MPSEPVAPTTDVQLSIPIVNRLKYIEEFAAKDTLLKRAPDGGYVYQSSQSVQPIRIDTIKVQASPSYQQVTLGTYVVDPPPPTGDTLTYREITGVDPPPVPVVTPAQTFVLPSVTQGPVASYETLTFETGTITLRVRNRFPVPVDFPDPIILKNNRTATPRDTNEVARFSYGAKVFQPGEESSTTANLANVTMQNLLRVVPFRMRTQASGGPVTFTQQSGIEYAMTITNIRVKSGRAKIPAQNILRARDSLFTVDDSVALQSAYFRSGTFDIVMQNTVDATIRVYLSFNDIQNR